MNDLIAPHGASGRLVDRLVPAEEVAEFTARAAGWAKVPVSDADLSTLYRLGDGGLTPLTGPMDRETYQRVLDEEVLLDGGKKYAWTIPLAFPVSGEQAARPRRSSSV